VKNVTPRFYLRLKFKVLIPITGLEFYQGVYWSAMLRDWIRPYASQPLSEINICPIPVQNGFQEYYPEDVIALDISLPQDSLASMLNMLRDELNCRSKATFPEGRLHFAPGKTVKLLGYQVLPDHSAAHTIDSVYINNEAALLNTQKQLSIVFHTPLRLKPSFNNKAIYRYLDPLSFDSQSFFAAFCREFDIEAHETAYPAIHNKGLIWMDVHYEKTLGGLIGGITIDTPQDIELLQALVWGQYSGIGKNRSFGFGFYYIKESSGFRGKPLSSDYLSFLNCSASIKNLSLALEEMKSGSPGPDNLAKEDLLTGGRAYLDNARKRLLKGDLTPGDSLTFRKRSHNGNFRIIHVQNIHERHLLISILRQIDCSLDRLISPNCYSYRSGKDYHQAAKRVFYYFRQGFKQGFKADISSYFDSIPRPNLRLLLNGLFNTDAITDVISGYLLSDGVGIPQGNPISPLLSNLYLIPFDKEIKNKGWQLVRYADDFCIFATPESPEELSLAAISTIVQKLGLSISAEKSTMFSPADTITYCGYQIDSKQHNKIKQPPPIDYESNGIPAFQEDMIKGKPLYLSYKDSYARVDNNSIIIQRDEGNKTFSMKEISRIIIIGKPRVSAGLIQQALIHQKPVSFMSIMGHTLGGFAQQHKIYSPQSVYNSVSKDWDTFLLDFVRVLVAAKIHNQRTVLKQNNIIEPRLKELELSLADCTECDSLRGKEGAASVIYWSHFRELVKPLSFPRRAYHPPEGPVNSLLSIGYSILYFRISECLSAAQLNPYEGMFHQPRGMHQALASDMIEPFRFLIDRIVLSLIHNRQVSEQDFIPCEYSSFKRLASEAMKNYIHRYEFTMRNEVIIGEETLSWALVIDRSAAQLMRCLRLGIDFKPHRMS